MTRRQLAFRLTLLLAVVLLTFVGLEGALRVVEARRPKARASTAPPLFVTCGNCPQLYRMNPEHPDVSSQGLRDRDFAVPKPDGVFRILILGDSVTYGFRVELAATFPKRLESRLNRPPDRVEVINAGVNGYSAYNEWQYFLAEGRAFQPDVVVVAFCMNDVADPELQWNWDAAARADQFTTNLGLRQVPAAAIPDPAYNRAHAAPRLDALRRRVESPWYRSRLYALVERRLARLRHDAEVARDTAGRPVFITGEDTLSIEALLNPASARMQWLKTTYASLAAAVRQEGAVPIGLILPLAYQVDRSYPHVPQDVIAQQCRENQLPCLDVLPAFRTHAGPELFLGRRSGFDDVWHLSEAGHQLVADQLAAFLAEQGALRR